MKDMKMQDLKMTCF